MIREAPTPGFARGLPQTQAALGFAARAHRGQRSSDGEPFIRHPLEVAALLYDAGAPDDLIAAGILHDVVERTNTAGDDLAVRFGAHVAELVDGVTDDPLIAGFAARKAALCERVAAADREVLLLFAADKVSKVRELRRAVARDGWQRQHRARLRHYRHCLEVLRQHLGEWGLVDRLAFELDCLTVALPVVPSPRPRA